MKFKLIFITILWMIYFGFEKIIYPLISNSVATNQFEDSAQSFITMQSWITFNTWLPIILIIISVLMILPNIKRKFKNIKGENVMSKLGNSNGNL